VIPAAAAKRDRFTNALLHRRPDRGRDEPRQRLGPWREDEYVNLSMSKPVVEVQVHAVAATGSGSAVFLGNEDKVFVMFVDEGVGTAIAMFTQGTQKDRPLTHDLLVCD